MCNASFWLKMEAEMSVDILEQVVKKVLRAMAKSPDTLVYCHMGSHHSGSFLIFVIAFIEEGSKVQNMMDQYIDDLACQPHNFGCLYQIWHKSGLSNVLHCARLDPELQSLVAETTPKMAEHMSHMHTVLKSWIPQTINIPECKAGQDSKVEG